MIHFPSVWVWPLIVGTVGARCRLQLDYALSLAPHHDEDTPAAQHGKPDGQPVCADEDQPAPLHSSEHTLDILVPWIGSSFRRDPGP